MKLERWGQVEAASFPKKRKRKKMCLQSAGESAFNRGPEKENCSSWGGKKERRCGQTDGQTLPSLSVWMRQTKNTTAGKTKKKNVASSVHKDKSDAIRCPDVQSSRSGRLSLFPPSVLGNPPTCDCEVDRREFGTDRGHPVRRSRSSHVTSAVVRSLLRTT